MLAGVSTLTLFAATKHTFHQDCHIRIRLNNIPNNSPAQGFMLPIRSQAHDC
jgi:hypothetical protein